jgi:hypothetical protein
MDFEAILSILKLIFVEEPVLPMTIYDLEPKIVELQEIIIMK